MVKKHERFVIRNEKKLYCQERHVLKNLHKNEKNCFKRCVDMLAFEGQLQLE